MNNRGTVSWLLLITVTLTTLLLPATPIHSSAAPQQVLLLYDSLANGTAKEGNVTEIQRLLASYSAKVTLMSLDQYKKDSMMSYSNVITMINAADLMPTNKHYLEDLDNYSGKYLHIGYNPPVSLKKGLQLTTDVMYSGSADLRIGQFTGVHFKVQDMLYIAASKATRSYGSLSFADPGLQVPYAISQGKYTYVPYLEQENASTLAMAYVLKEWLHITASSHTYLVIKEIYPFSDLSLLEDTAEQLYQAGIPFIASVRPVFSNTDYPAMKRYLAALRMVQSRNGSIVVNAPVAAHSTSTSGRDYTLIEKMNGFINLLVANGIAPLGIGAETHWTYDKEYSEAGTGFFDSAVLYPDDKITHMEQTNTSYAFTSSLYSMQLEFLQEVHMGSKMLPEFPINTGITFDFPEDEEGLEEMLQSLERYWISFADYKQEDHQVVTDSNTVASSQGIISINGQQLNLDYTLETVDSDYLYVEEQEKSFTKLFSIQNQFYIVVIMISLLLFGGLFIIGYRLYRRKFLK